MREVPLHLSVYPLLAPKC